MPYLQSENTSMAGASRGRGHGRGSLGRGSGGKRIPDRAHQTRPCRFFRTNGSCRFGSSCKFSHDQGRSDRGFSLPSRNRIEPTGNGEDEQTRYNDWKDLIRRRPTVRAQGNTSVLHEIWSGALAILDGQSREWHHSLLRDVIDDKYFGCAYLLLTLGIRVTSHNGQDWGFVEDFLRTITHASILDCLSVDTYVGTLYNLIGGVGGGRAIAFFLEVCRGRLGISDQLSGTSDLDQYDRCLAAMSDALYQLLVREKRTLFHHDLPELLRLLDQMFDVLDLASTKRSQVCCARRDRLEVLHKMVDISAGLMVGSVDGDTQNPTGVGFATTPSTVYPIEMTAPGGRHDNDHIDIAQICIIPTAAEIASNEPDYLPSTDCRQPHFHNDPVQRYFDTHFRLLRHDTFGPFKEVLSPLMHPVNDGTDSFSRLPVRDTSAHYYQHASVAHICIHEKRGFEAHISFALPPHLRKETGEERRHWWENSKRLEPGSLVCLLYQERKAVEALRLIVAEKSIDLFKKSGSGSGGQTGVTIVKLATLVQKDLQLLIQMYQTKAKGLLIGMPGLLPATFTPILENLQQVIRTAQLPFKEWLVAMTNTQMRDRIASPPRYSQQAGFSYSLDSIRKATGKGLSINASASPRDSELLDQLESETDLDRGQCLALICALTREYALIQGPPGTGKSYLGVKLIQVLIACKEAAKLGPIVVMSVTAVLSCPVYSSAKNLSADATQITPWINFFCTSCALAYVKSSVSVGRVGRPSWMATTFGQSVQVCRRQCTRIIFSAATIQDLRISVLRLAEG